MCKHIRDSKVENLNMLTIRKHYESMPTKKSKFLDKKFCYFLNFISKHRLWVLVRTAPGYSLEPLRRGGSNEYLQSMF